jgi:hypothetical protein
MNVGCWILTIGYRYDVGTFRVMCWSQTCILHLNILPILSSLLRLQLIIYILKSWKLN